MHDARRANEIDLLRFLAALAVVLFHYFHLATEVTGGRMLYPRFSPWARYGYLGVDLFFLISGFVITMSAKRGSVRSFAASRAARLLPAFWVCCTVTFLVLAAAGDWRGVASYLENMSMVALVAPIRVMDGSYWSLSYELRFYALVAAVLALGIFRHAEKLLFAWLIAAIALVIIPLRLVKPVVMPDYAAYFIAGATLYFVWANGLTARRGLMLAACLSLAEYNAIRFASTLEARDGVPFEPLVVGAIVAVCFLVLLAVALRRTGALARGDWLAIGALTYPLYLLHQVVGITLIHVGGRWIDRQLLLWMVIALMIVAARLINTQVEARLSGLLRRVLEGARPFREGAGVLGR